MSDPTPNGSSPDFSFLSGDETPPEAAVPPADFDFSAAQGDTPAESHVEAGPTKEIAPLPLEQKAASRPPKESAGSSAKTPRKRHSRTTPAREKSNPAERTPSSTAVDSVPRSKFNLLAGYSAALTLVFLYLILSGRLSGAHSLESLPDVKPLAPGEFQAVPVGTSLPANHELRIGESRRFGDIILTPQKVTWQPLEFAHMSSGEVAREMTGPSVMHLWFRMENAGAESTFAPWDLHLMTHRNATRSQGDDSSVLANSYLAVLDANGIQTARVLNYMHSPQSTLDIVSQNSNTRIAPGESIVGFVASSDEARQYRESASSYRWRIQIRKGLNGSSGNGVTTLVDVAFTPQQVTSAGGA